MTCLLVEAVCWGECRKEEGGQGGLRAGLWVRFFLGGGGHKSLNGYAGGYFRVYVCWPVEEGILNSWIGGLVAHPLGWGARSNTETYCEWWAASSATPKNRGNVIFAR